VLQVGMQTVVVASKGTHSDCGYGQAETTSQGIVQ
jgi:hypothetical protein